ncbi:MAG: hypothetical protein FE834_00185 [Gammaproteobacteria bacterium]|uniref:Uncharacterized protein n=1 Tax=hydrothermal vent metagenome TaxID=652676 RepID=A0A1W1E4W8_9ZZZZ|nr:hypothetical protein [Gammaproteobacteria bacterium]
MGFIEKVFLKMTQIIGLLFVIIVLIMAGMLGYNNISITDEKADMPIIQFADYQKMAHNQENTIANNLGNNQQFKQQFNSHINNIVIALSNLSDQAVDKKDLKQKVKMYSKIKLNRYPQSVQLSYVQSLAKLTNQVAIVGAKVNIDELTNWHDRSFFRQIQENSEANFIKIGIVKIKQNTYATLWNALLIFAMLVIMLAVLRIERNTRK